MNADKGSERFSTNWIIFLVVTLIAVMIAGAVLVRGRVDGGGSGELMTAGIGGGTSHFSNLSAADIEATDDLTVGDDASIGDDLTVSGNTIVSGYARVASVTAISITNGCTITPTGTYQPLESAGTVGCGDIVTGTAGDSLVLINTSDTSITITDTGSLKLGSNRVLAQYDSLELWSDGTYWIEVGYAENGTGTTTFSNLATTDLAVADDLTVTDDLAVTGLMTVGEYGIYTEQTAVVVTEGNPITPTGTYQPINSASAVTTSTTCAVYSGTVNGQVVFLVNENASDAIIVDDGANTDLGGNVTLGAGDILKLLWDGANWLGLGTANN